MATRFQLPEPVYRVQGQETTGQTGLVGSYTRTAGGDTILLSLNTFLATAKHSVMIPFPEAH